MESIKTKFLNVSKDYKDYCIKIDLSNRFKTNLTALEKKELTRLNNLRYKLQEKYIQSL